MSGSQDGVDAPSHGTAAESTSSLEAKNEQLAKDKFEGVLLPSAKVSNQKAGVLASSPGGSTTQAEINRLRIALNTEIAKREQLARQGVARNVSWTARSTSKGSAISPAVEGSMSTALDESFATPVESAMDTASTESAKTIRGCLTPGVSSALTPSYPFPSMKTPRMMSWNTHRPFTALSPTVEPENFVDGSFDGPSGRISVDNMLSDSVTPASTPSFQPSGSSKNKDDFIYPTPNLYDLTLALNSEPGLEPWWDTVCEIMKDHYKASRVTLSIPADWTDVENVPWGQKATFNNIDDDHLSMACFPRGSSVAYGSSDANVSQLGADSNGNSSFAGTPGAQASTLRPTLQSRHSFNNLEQTKQPSEVNRTAALRQPMIFRSNSSYGAGYDQVPRASTLRRADLNLATLKEYLAIEELKHAEKEESSKDARGDKKGRVFLVLQALDYEADALIDSSGINRVLERGKVIALTRQYPYLDINVDEASPGSSSSSIGRKEKLPAGDNVSEGSKKKADIHLPFTSSSLGSRHARKASRGSRSLTSDKGKLQATVHVVDGDEQQQQLQTTRFEEYEQAPQSPWSQSPAPSPAVRAETAENPFFATASIDEESFNPSSSQADYNAPIEAIGMDRSCTVLHIPLIHPLLSRPVHAFRLDAAMMKSKSAGKSKDTQDENTATTSNESYAGKPRPIAVLSVLSPLNPYTSNLRRSLSDLAPHLATSFSLCRHYSNLEFEIIGLSRKRSGVTGFGAVPPDLHADVKISRAQRDHVGQESSTQSVCGSLASPSINSTLSRSSGPSPSPITAHETTTPFLLGRRPVTASPNINLGESYFTPKSTVSRSKGDAAVACSHRGVRLPHSPSMPNTKDLLVIESEPSQQECSKTSVDRRRFSDGSSIITSDKSPGSPSSNLTVVSSGKDKPMISGEIIYDQPSTLRCPSSPKPAQQSYLRGVPGTAGAIFGQGHTHTQLHSYGADFSSTFQSLPNTTTSGPSMSIQDHVQLRDHADMPPPSDRVKTLMLDTLPAHLFVAVPQTGEIVWVNNRYLTYRGQTVADLRNDPWGSIHPDELESYLKGWGHTLRTGEQFSMQVRIRRFDGKYRWFYIRAVGGRDTRGVVVQWYGSYMDIHDQHIAEVKAARQEEIEASEAKHRLLANLIPQIIFAATEEEGITFANEQWLTYTGQDFEGSLGLSFMDFVHPEDLAKCRIPLRRSPSPDQTKTERVVPLRVASESSSGRLSDISKSSDASDAPTEATMKATPRSFSQKQRSGSESTPDLLPPNLKELAKTGVIKITTDSNGRLSYTTEIRLKSRTGEYRWHLVRCVEVDNINFGRGDGSWFGACTDINDHKLLEAALKEAMESKSKFLSNMSHEIRTPLIGISGMINFLQDTVLTEEQSDYTNTIATSASSLLMIINDILDLAKVDSGMMKLTYEWFHTRSLIEDVNELVSTMAIQKRIELNYVVDEDVPAMVKGDKFRIRQVLLNIIGNAIKFTEEGEVFSHCEISSEYNSELGENETMLKYSVIDTGSGFTEEQKAKMFKPFSQVDGSITRQHGGTGLGLVISRTLVELHGGHMEGHGSPGKGATFTFTVKLGLPSAEDCPAALSTPASKAPSRRPSGVGEPPRLLPSESGSSTRSFLTSLQHKSIKSPHPVSPKSDLGPDSPTLTSSASSDPSIRSIRTHLTDRSSASSINPNLVHFGEAARHGQPDLSGMNLSIPDKPQTEVPRRKLAVSDSMNLISDSPVEWSQRLRPPMYSILIVCSQAHSREATVQHVEMTLPSDIPHQITPLASVKEAQELLGGDDPVIFTHIILNLSNAEDIIPLMDQIFSAASQLSTSIVILSDPVQRQTVMKLVPQHNYGQLAKDNRVTFVYKPVKPSRFAVIFDPDKERDLSTDRNRSNAEQVVATQKQNYAEAEKKLGNRGLRILLVEDNLVNQKVLLKYLSKVGVEVEVVNDGVEATEKVFEKPHDYFSLILCDLHMPRKDGYQTCRDIRAWEASRGYSKLPIIALSANVMADVVDKTNAAGFSSYVTKPVDFKALSNAMDKLLGARGMGKA